MLDAGVLAVGVLARVAERGVGGDAGGMVRGVVQVRGEDPYADTTPQPWVKER